MRLRDHPAVKWILMSLVSVGMGVWYYLSDTPTLFIGYFAGSLWLCLPIIYWICHPDWHLSPTGRAMMNLFFSLALLFLLIITSGIFGASEWRDILRILVYSWVAMAAIRTGILLIQLRLGADWFTGKKGK